MSISADLPPGGSWHRQQSVFIGKPADRSQAASVTCRRLSVTGRSGSWHRQQSVFIGKPADRSQAASVTYRRLSVDRRSGMARFQPPRADRVI
jgi:hypothetical protein